ncbi:hypothetical protein [Methylobacterium trifolii]|uniref:hypothetical protein n=1 Tax=Methylobacterium trifolii TaxID=1003092 RepID=UPI001EE0A972|nr:hypothetical protein [Methylobacterium trifolii]
MIVPNLSRGPQCAFFARAHDHLEILPDLVSKALAIEADGSVTVFPLPDAEF